MSLQANAFLRAGRRSPGMGLPKEAVPEQPMEIPKETESSVLQQRYFEPKQLELCNGWRYQ